MHGVSFESDYDTVQIAGDGGKGRRDWFRGMPRSPSGLDHRLISIGPTQALPRHLGRLEVVSEVVNVSGLLVEGGEGVFKVALPGLVSVLEGGDGAAGDERGVRT